MGTYTEFESQCVKLAPLFGAASVTLADNMFTNFKSYMKEFQAMESIFAGIAKKYPFNSLVQEYFSLDSSKFETKKLMFLPEEIYPTFEGKEISNPELKTYLEVPQLKKLVEEANAGGMTKRLSYSCLIVTVIAKTVLEREKNTESKEFFKAVYECAEEVAKAAKEGWFGLGDAISKNEAALLAKIKENIL